MRAARGCEAQPTTLRIVGVGGPSGSGKSSIAAALAEALCSPICPLSMDLFFDRRKNTELGTWERPEGFDVGSFLAALTSIAEAVAKAATAESPTQLLQEHLIHTKRCGWQHIVRESCDAAVAPPVLCGDVFVIVEGFLLCAFPEVCERLDAVLFLDADKEELCARRFTRSRRSTALAMGPHRNRGDAAGAPDARTDPSLSSSAAAALARCLFGPAGDTSQLGPGCLDMFLEYRRWYMDDVHHHHLLYIDQQRSNAAAILGPQRVATLHNSGTLSVEGASIAAVQLVRNILELHAPHESLHRKPSP